MPWRHDWPPALSNRCAGRLSAIVLLRAGGQSVATATFPPSIGIFAGRRLEPSGERIFSRAIARIARGAHFATKSAAARVLPSYWFLAIFNQLNGSAHPALAPLAKRGWIGIAVAAFGACAALLLCYFRSGPASSSQTSFALHARSHGRHNGETRSRKPLPFSAFEPLRCEAASTA